MSPHGLARILFSSNSGKILTINCLIMLLVSVENVEERRNSREDFIEETF